MKKIKIVSKTVSYAGEPALRKMAMKYRDKNHELEVMLRKSLPWLVECAQTHDNKGLMRLVARIKAELERNFI